MFFDGSLTKNNEDEKRIGTRSSRVALGGNFGGASQPGLLLPTANLRMKGSTCTGTYPQLYTTQRTSRTYRGPGTIFMAPRVRTEKGRALTQTRTHSPPSTPWVTRSTTHDGYTICSSMFLQEGGGPPFLIGALLQSSSRGGGEH